MTMERGTSGLLTLPSKKEIMEAIMERLEHMNYCDPLLDLRFVKNSLIQNIVVLDQFGDPHYLTLTLRETI